MHVQQQENNTDCGPFAIAFAKSILAGQGPDYTTLPEPQETSYTQFTCKQDSWISCNSSTMHTASGA